MAHGHEDVISCPGEGLENVWELRCRERMVAHHVKRGGNAGEHVLPSVVDFGKSPVHGLWREVDVSAEQVADPLVAQADSQDRERALQNGTCAYTEVTWPIGSPGTRRDNDIVKAGQRQVSPINFIVAYDDRCLPIYLTEELVEIIRE
jgi:hypothetical protein